MTKVEGYEILEQGINLAVREIKTNLEILAVNLDSNFPMVKAQQLPEYQKAMDAINQYHNAIQNKMRNLGDQK